ncbi:MAG TPA: phenylalanine--tRNA ligase subunit beta [Dermatophilaceae bacterium]|jgi:phenylalanyl-tRNA synthetase beta chain|nr:phenylalanine--tRNA ligase subunit beta [Actinomycetales bacterium]HMT31501.1 phenylalanine--tRNA ligase subunit beta [Dermatophilaceae bacterium]HMT89290.1 phenylalanine--tRNA ligase subunit beta [Dermatophilaceae bacterium]
MRVPLSWLAELVDLAPGARGVDVAASLVGVGLEEEALHGSDLTGPLVVGRVLTIEEAVQKNGKTIRYCTVDVGEHGQRVTDGIPQEIVCGATNFVVGDLVVVVLPGAVLPGGFAISARKTYGRVSNGMICAEDELGLGEDHSGIIVLTDYLGAERAAALQPGEDAIALLGLDDEVLEVNVTPDRGYCFSMRGIAREYWHSQGSPAGTFRDPALVSQVPHDTTTGYAVHLTDGAPIEGADGCDRYVARIVRGVDPSAPSPDWMAARLTQAGMRPISLAVDVTNYVMLLVGQPLHAFDLQTLSGSIVVRRAKDGERLTTLDDVERALSVEDLLITDGGQEPLAIAGVMGGATSEVTAATTDILIEAAHFDPVTVARSSRRHRLTTEASKRFERGVDPKVTAAAAQLAVDLLVAHGGGVADDGGTDVDLTQGRTAYQLDPDLPARLVGVPYSRERVATILRDLGCGVDDRGDTLSVTPPSWRPDLVDGPDYAEEVARIDGYERIPSVLPTPTAGRGLTHSQLVRRIVANTLVGRGCTEVLTYPFVAADFGDTLGLPADDPRRSAIRLANPLSDEAPLLRTSVIDSLVDALRRNVSRGQRDLALFELGSVTRPLPGSAHTAPVPGVHERPDAETIASIDAAVPPQPRHLGIVLAGESERSGWWGKGRPADWADAVDLVRAVAASLSLTVSVEPDQHAPWHPGRCARLSLADGTLLGYAGELHPAVLKRLGLPQRTCAAEVSVDALAAASENPAKQGAFSTRPVALTDVALTVAESVAAGEVERTLRAAAGEHLEWVTLFDVYRGEQVGVDQKSLAFRMAFRAPDRTLRTDEVSGYRDLAVAAAAARFGAVQR